MVRGQTIQRVASPTAILVGISEPFASSCSDVLADGGLKVLRVGHVAAACERIPVVMPQLVIVSATLPTAEAEMLADRCVAVGAEVVAIGSDAHTDAALKSRLTDAANTALIRALRGGS